jgi:hypothetical protein
VKEGFRRSRAHRSRFWTDLAKKYLLPEFLLALYLDRIGSHPVFNFVCACCEYVLPVFQDTILISRLSA